MSAFDDSNPGGGSASEIMQTSGGWIESVSRMLGLRIRTALGNALRLSHDDTTAHIEADGELRLAATEAARIEAQSLDLAAALFVTATLNAAEPADADLQNNRVVYYRDQLERVWIKWKDGEGNVRRECVANPDRKSGTTAQRPADPLPLQRYFDTDFDELLYWNETVTEWRSHTEAPA